MRIVRAAARRRSAASGFGYAALAVAALLFIMTSCTTVPASLQGVEPSAYLERDPDIYVRLSGNALRDLAGSDKASGASLLNRLIADGSDRNAGGSPGEKNSTAAQPVDPTLVEAFLARTSVFGAGLSDIGGEGMRTDAVFLGAFQPLSLRIALAADGRWKKEKDGGYLSTTSDLQLRPFRDGVIHLVYPKSPATRNPGANAFPGKFAGLANSDLFIALNSPQRLVATSIPLESSALPILALVITGKKLTTPSQVANAAVKNPADPYYSVDVHALMKDAATARAYRPVVRFVWVAAAARYFGGSGSSGPDDLSGNPTAVTDLPLTLDGDVYRIEGIRIRASEIGALLAGFSAPR